MRSAFLAYYIEHCWIAGDSKAPSTTTLGDFENRQFISTLGIPSTFLGHDQVNGASRKRSSNWRNLKTPVLRFSVGRKHFENLRRIPLKVRAISAKTNY